MTSSRLYAPFALRAMLVWLEDYKNGDSDLGNGIFFGCLLTLSPVVFMLTHHRMAWSVEMRPQTETKSVSSVGSGSISDIVCV